MERYEVIESVIDGRLHVLYDGRWLPVPSGGDGPVTPPPEGETPPEAEALEVPPAEGETPPEGEEQPEEAQGPDVPEDLTVLDGDALTALHAEVGEAIAETREAPRSRETVSRIQELIEARKRIAAEVNRRVEEDRQLHAELQEIDEALANEAPLPELPVPVASMTPRAPTSRELARARGAQTPAAQESHTPVQRVRVPLVAAVSGNRVGTGGDMTLADLGEVLDRVKQGNARTIVASFQPYEELPPAGIPELLGRGSPERNSELMREARDEWYARMRGELAMTASICTPLDILRDIPDEFNTAEPVSSMFPSRPAGRLGFQYFPSVDLSAVAGGVALWTETNQDNVVVDTASTWKVCLDVDCPTAQQIVATAIVACLTWDLTSEMSNPENIANLTAALTALRARVKEGKTLKAIDDNSYRYTYQGAYGAVPTVIDVLNTTIAQATYASRLDEAAYSAILPPGVVALLAIDMANRGYSSDLPSTTDVLAYVRDRVPGINNVVMSLDAATGGEPGLPFFPFNGPVGGSTEVLPSLEALSGGYHRIRILDPGAALYAETGQLNVGTTRDSQLLRANKVQYFAEEFTLLAKQGPSPWFSVDVRLCGDGARAGLVEPVGCTS